MPLPGFHFPLARIVPGRRPSSVAVSGLTLIVGH